MNHKKNAGISVKYIYSACVITKTEDIKILHDPWFTDGIYDGSWYHFPIVNNPLSSIGDVDCIYISHIHPDHYDSKFLKKYFKEFGEKEIFIADHSPNFLAKKMRGDGFSPTILKDDYIVGNTSITIIPHKTGHISDIDSVIIIKYKDKVRNHCVVNTNDIIFDDKMREIVKSTAGSVDILLCGFTGAGPYPQTYFDATDNKLSNEAKNKKLSFFERYKTLTSYINAKVNIPFAGKYILGGKLSHLNEFRGVADPVEVLDFDNDAIVLEDNGGQINTSTLVPTAERTSKYDKLEIDKRILEIKLIKMDYERLINKNEIQQLPIKKLLFSAVKNALNKSECETDYYFIFFLPGDEYAVINANPLTKSDNIYYVNAESELPTPRTEIIMDMRYLFGLLTNIYHWNNAEVGSQYNSRREPNNLNRSAQAFLNFLAI